MASVVVKIEDMDDTEKIFPINNSTSCSTDQKIGIMEKFPRTKEKNSSLKCIRREKSPKQDYLQKCLKKEQLFPCDICDKKFSKNYLKRHKESHYGVPRERLFKCGYCEKSFYRNGHLKVHVLIHTGEKPFQCRVCDKRFNQKGSLQEHMATHRSNADVLELDFKEHKCGHCTKVFASNPRLKRHIISAHSEGIRRHTCSVCDKTYKLLQHLKRHQKVHWDHTNPKFTCRYCDRSFIEKQHYTLHVNRHEGKESAHKCRFCDKGFDFRTHLEIHERSHTGERPFQCEVCGTNHISKGDLERHNRTQKHKHKQNMLSKKKSFLMLCKAERLSQ